jgi:hypothetical protein
MIFFLFKTLFYEIQLLAVEIGFMNKFINKRKIVIIFFDCYCLDNTILFDRNSCIHMYTYIYKVLVMKTDFQFIKLSFITTYINKLFFIFF